jgi:hypothetical protein
MTLASALFFLKEHIWKEYWDQPLFKLFYNHIYISIHQLIEIQVFQFYLDIYIH